MLISEFAEVKISTSTYKHYRDLGYEIPTYKNKSGGTSVKVGEKISVKTEDLTNGTHTKVHYRCDNCGKEYDIEYKTYIAKRKKQGRDYCKNCKKEATKNAFQKKYGVDNVFQLPETIEKRKQTMMDRYGVDNPSKLDFVKEKKKQTTLLHYGVESPSQSDVVMEKIKKTNLEKYGTECPFLSPQIQERINQTNLERYGTLNPHITPEAIQKRENTMMERYGVSNPMQSEVVREKAKKTNKEKYGFEYASQAPQVKEKNKKTNLQKYGYISHTQRPEERERRRKAIMEQGNLKVSSQQEYLNNLFNTECNAQIGKYYLADMMDNKNMLVIEYDGGGHNLHVQMGKLTQQEFEQKELIREKVIRQNGFRLIRIISPTDKLPSDEILLQMLHEALEYFNATNHTWRKYYVELGIMKDTEHKDGAKYDYGTLWNAKVLAKQNKSA